MLRRSPMRRTGFSRPDARRGFPVQPGSDWERARMPQLECGHDTPLHRGTYTATAGAAQPKRRYVLSDALLDAVRSMPRCAFCWGIGPVVPCHSNWGVHGKGKSIKADDNRVAAGCAICHHELDQGKNWSEEERKARWWDAHVLTIRQLLERGLWPVGVPVPDTAHNPFTIDGEPAADLADLRS